VSFSLPICEVEVMAIEKRSTYFSKEKAQHAIDFIQDLSHTNGEWAGKPFILMPWQKKIVSDVFGTVKPDGIRQYTTAYVELPKKNGKSELAAAIALLLTIADGEPGAEVYSCAADRAQASIVFNVAAQMVRQHPYLSQIVKIIPSNKRILYPELNSFYQVLSADVPNKHGLNVHGVVFDELHTQPNRKLYDVMTHGSGDARRQPLYFFITTAGNDHNSICYEVHKKAKDIISGRKFDPTFYPVIYGAEEHEDWTSEKVWKKANPSLGVTISIDKVRAACENAKQNPAEENIFRQLRLNQWMKQNVRWMPMDKWNKCGGEIELEKLRGRECYAGLDLSSTTDLTAFVLVFPPRLQGGAVSEANDQTTSEDEKFIVLPYFWMPEDNVYIRVKKDNVPYDIWEKQGFINTTEGNVVDYRFLQRDIMNICSEFVVKEIAYDRWNATQIILNLQDEGLTMVRFGQGFESMSGPTKDLMRLVLSENLIHGNHPVLSWMADNVTAKIDEAENIKLDKAKSTERIDGMVALVMALARAMVNINAKTGSVYDERGIWSV